MQERLEMGHENSLVGEIDRCVYLSSFLDAMGIRIDVVVALFRFLML